MGEKQSKAAESEQDLIRRAREAVSQSNWIIGECAAKWTERFSKGRTDADFGLLIDMTGDQVYQRRRAWETFSDVYQQYASLTWSHFYAALNWDDAAECLRWADDMQSTIVEMKAWRRAQHGEDLSAPSENDEDFGGDGEYAEALTPTSGIVRDPAEMGGGGGRSGERARGRSAQGEESPVVAGVAREAEGGSDYSPFGKKARGTPQAGERKGQEKEGASVERTILKLTAQLEKCVKALTPGVLDEFSEIPSPVRRSFLKAVSELQSRVAGLK